MSQSSSDSLPNVQMEHALPKFSSSSIPAGLEFLYGACRQIYPDQPNPLQVTAVVKYWLGGPDPLDYISMYYNLGTEAIPPHWHYVSFGLSDLHGDGRVHEISGPQETSGFGFELTMRVCCEEGEQTPPTWPAALMQGLAKYVFQSESSFCVGDHISWHSALDNSESRVRHMLITDDTQLGLQATPFGKVQFVQIVGVTSEELAAAQHWNGCGILNMLKRFTETGGEYLITNMKRVDSIYDLDSTAAQEVEKGIEKEGSNLSGVSANMSWCTYDREGMHRRENESIGSYSSFQSQYVKYALGNSSENRLPVSKSVENNYRETMRHESDSFATQTLPSLHLTINAEAGVLLPLALRGRLKHGRHFTFKSRLGVNALTLLSPAVQGAFATSELPYTLKGPWLQVYVDEELLNNMISDLTSLAIENEITDPVTFEWPRKKLKITIVNDDH